MGRGIRRLVRPAAAGAFAVALLVVAPTASGTITVANNNDSGPGSLRQAIAGAAAGETIVVPPNTYTLTTGELAVAKSLAITGAGAGSTIISGGGTSRIFHTSGATST